MPVLKFFKDVTKYGLSNSYELAGSFNGHMKGLAICIINGKTGEVETNYLPKSIGDDDTRAKMLDDLLNDKEIPKVKQHIRQDGDGDGINTIVYLQYVVQNHSFLHPTVSSQNIPGVPGKPVRVAVELLFSIDGLNRYVTAFFYTETTSVMDLVYNMFDDEQALSNIGCILDDNTKSLVLDFYDEVGDRTDIEFENAIRLRDQLVSVRLIDITGDDGTGDNV